MRWIAVLLVVTVQMLAGCDREPRVNAKGTEAERKSSIEAVKNSLAADRKAQFEEAVKTLLFADVQGLADLADGEGIARRFEDRINGLTAEEIIAEAARVQGIRAEKERQRRLEQINELAKNLEAGADAETISQFMVERARLKTSESSTGGREATAELSVRNGTKSAVSKVYFHAVVLTPGREIPWVDTEFNYEIPGGLEPGENASWRLTPNMFGEWSKVPADRLDTIFVVRAIQLDGADRKPLGPERLGDSEEARLLELLNGMDGDRPKAVRALLDARRAASLAWREKTVPIAAVQERDELHLAREQLSKIRILRTRLVKRERGFLSEPIVEALIENGSPSIIEWVRGEIKITSADREVPWDEGQFIGLARPGLEPGAQAWVSLSKSSTFGLGRWTLPPEDAKAEVQPRVESAEAPKTASPFELEFTARDEKRLEALEALIAAQAWK